MEVILMRKNKWKTVLPARQPGRLLLLLLVPLWLQLVLTPLCAAAQGLIDLNRNVSLTLTFRDGTTALTGASFDIYLVAKTDAIGELTPTDAFRSFPVNIRGENESAWRALASTLEGYVLRDRITPTESRKTDSKGQAVFGAGEKKLTPGLYLVLGHRHTQNGSYYDSVPFMVLLPGQDEKANDWNYQVTASVKYNRTDVPDQPALISRKVLKVWKDEGNEAARPKEVIVQLLCDGKVYSTVTLNAANNWRHTWDNLDSRFVWAVVEKEPSGYTVQITREGITFVITNIAVSSGGNTPPTTGVAGISAGPGGSGVGVLGLAALPQTGQLWWPVPLLTAAGMLFIIIGLLSRRNHWK